MGLILKSEGLAKKQRLRAEQGLRLTCLQLRAQNFMVLRSRVWAGSPNVSVFIDIGVDGCRRVQDLSSRFGTED